MRDKYNYVAKKKKSVKKSAAAKIIKFLIFPTLYVRHISHLHCLVEDHYSIVFFHVCMIDRHLLERHQKFVLAE